MEVETAFYGRVSVDLSGSSVSNITLRSSFIFRRMNATPVYRV